MRNLEIFTKLFLSHTALGLLSAILICDIFYTVISDAVLQRTLGQLSSINILKKDLVESYFFRLQQNLEALQVEKKFTTIYRDLSTTAVHSSDNSDLNDIENLCRLYDFKNLHVLDTHHRQLFSTDQEMYLEGLLRRVD